MKKIKVEALTPEAFAPFGTYVDVLSPEGPCLKGEYHTFYRDIALHYSESGLPLGISPLIVQNHGNVVEGVEWHNHTCEGILPLDDDAILHVTPAGGDFDVTQTKAFLVPKGTFVSLHPGVFHLTPLPKQADALHALILLPERAYANDFCFHELTEEEKFELVL